MRMFAMLAATAVVMLALPMAANARVHEVRKGPTCALGSDLLVGVKDADCKWMNARLDGLENNKIVKGCWLYEQYAASLNDDQCSLLGGEWGWIKP